MLNLFYLFGRYPNEVGVGSPSGSAIRLGTKGTALCAPSVLPNARHQPHHEAESLINTTIAQDGHDRKLFPGERWRSACFLN
jgi:hypothetical protein